MRANSCSHAPGSSQHGHFLTPGSIYTEANVPKPFRPVCICGPRLLKQPTSVTSVLGAWPLENWVSAWKNSPFHRRRVWHFLPGHRAPCPLPAGHSLREKAAGGLPEAPPPQCLQSPFPSGDPARNPSQPRREEGPTWRKEGPPQMHPPRWPVGFILDWTPVLNSRCEYLLGCEMV